MINRAMCGVGLIASLCSTQSMLGQMIGLTWEVDTCFYANSVEPGATLFDVGLEGQTTYRLYANFTHPGDELQAVYALGLGEELSPPWTLEAPCGCFEHEFGTSIGVGFNPVLLNAFPSLGFDSFYTLDHHPGTSIVGGLPEIGGPLDLPEICNTNLVDAAMYVLGGVSAGSDLKVLIGQITTCGSITFSACFQVQLVNGTVQNWCSEESAAGPLFIDPPCAFWDASNTTIDLDPNVSPVGVSIPYASAYPVEVELYDALTDQYVITLDANPDFSPPEGTYYAALKDANTCRDTTDVFCIPPPFYSCDGTCLDDTDGDGVCDPLEIPGCLDPESCNFEPLATDLIPCIYAEAGYDCEGNCLIDSDGDGICDPFEVPGCMDEWACNFNAEATDNDGSCTYMETFVISGPSEGVTETTYTFSYPSSAENACNWTAEGGTIEFGLSTSEIGVSWSSPGVYALSVQEMSDTCTSAPVSLDVTIGINDVRSAPHQEWISTQANGWTAQSTGSLQIWEWTGQLCFEQRLTPGEYVPFPRLPSGLYPVRFQLDDGSEETWKIWLP